MSLAVLDPVAPAETAPARVEASVDAAIDAVCTRLAPLWPLETFVAVNPFLGFVDRPFEDACAELRRLVGIDMLPTADAGSSDPLARPRPLDARTAFMIDEISRWCAAYYDDGQAVWRAPSRHLGLYAGWKAAMVHDRNAEAMGIAGFRATVAAAPADARAAIAGVVEALDIPADEVEDYLFRALFDVRGWAAYARQRLWVAALHGGTNDDLVDLLAVRVVWDRALARSQRSAPRAPRTAVAAASDAAIADGLGRLTALETTYQRNLFAALGRADASPRARRPALQAAFCIDVRSEVFRRALEAALPGAQTLGFAGFFGMPIAFVPFGRDAGRAQCPALLAPPLTVHEQPKGSSDRERAERLTQLRTRNLRGAGWQAFKRAAVASFAFVESVGLMYAARLLMDGFGLTRHAPQGRTRDDMAPELPSADTRLELATNLLRGMSLTERFARLVLLAGHGASSTNNPYASGLDCGACGGHSGDANARLAARVLNDIDVRAGLAARGIAIPADTVFVAGLHDTTTDALTLYDRDAVPASHADDLARLEQALAEAGAITRAERAARLGLDASPEGLRDLLARSQDWSQTRPEWGLAGCAAFIAAPRESTRALDLGGRAFLHDYSWAQDTEGRVLEQIMSAPMVVASWINLQYYASSVDNDAFGSGNKTLHNVVAGLGVMEGAGGHLRSGLPWQSVSDGTALVHEPRRLTAVLAAPVEAIERVLARQAGVRELVEHGWLHLFALPPGGEGLQRRGADGRWERFA
ncbi:MAG: DUF2309 family protein [Xanthomonadaceae bacterium]|nr:DUF2309 family protein [Xanthomonadaceae bacterium]